MESTQAQRHRFGIIGLQRQEFNKKDWLAEYMLEPKNFRNQTRPRIELLVAELCPLPVIELNAYPYATRDERQLSAEMKDTSVLKFMLGVAKPRFVFIFGKKPAKELASLLRVHMFHKGTYTPVSMETSASQFL